MAVKIISKGNKSIRAGGGIGATRYKRSKTPPRARVSVPAGAIKRTRVSAKFRKRNRAKSRYNRPMILQGDLRDLNSDDKRQACLEYRLMGYSEYDIGVALGVSQPRVSIMLKEVLQEKSAAIQEMGEELRAMELERIDRMILAWFKAAHSGKDPRASEVMLRWVERRHKILGLDITRIIGTNGAVRMGATSIDLVKLGNHKDCDRLLANLEEIMNIAGPQSTLPDDELPAIEHKRPMKTIN